MLKKFGALAIFASSALIASATDYPECFVKYRNTISAQGGATGTDFEFINSDLDKDFTPLKYNVCLDGRNSLALISFQMTYADADGNNEVQTPRVGPDSSSCTDKTIPVEDRMYYKSASVVTSASIVHAFSLTPRRDGAAAQEFFRMQSGVGYSQADLSFSDEDDLIGFYGKQTATGITQLGFIVRDNQCIADAKQAEIDAAAAAEAEAQRQRDEEAAANITPTAPGKTENFSSETETVDKGPFTESIAFIGIVVVIASVIIAIIVVTVTHFVTAGKAVSARVANDGTHTVDNSANAGGNAGESPHAAPKDNN